MQIRDILSPPDMLFRLRAVEKEEILAAMARHAALAVDADVEAIMTALRKREALGSTGMGGGVALPHARLPGLARTYGALARLKSPVAFEAIDDEPVDIVLMLLIPSDGEAMGLNAMACAARRLRDPAAAARMRRAASADELYEAISAVSASAAPAA